MHDNRRLGSWGLIAGLVLGGLTLAWLSLAGPASAPTVATETSIRRIVCLHPAATELLFALGLADRLVGVSDFCTVPPAAQDRPSVGDTVHPNFERLVALRPDLVIVSGELPAITQFCRRRGLRVENLHMEGIDGIHRGIERLGRLLDHAAGAAALWTEIETELLAVHARVAGRAAVPAFFAFYRTPGSLAGMTTAGRGTYIDDLIGLAGGRNVFGDVNEPYPQISKETLLRRRPEVIIEPRDPASLSPERAAALRADWRVLPLPAVEAGRIAFPDQDLLLRPGPRVARAARTLAEILHPECFRD